MVLDCCKENRFINFFSSEDLLFLHTTTLNNIPDEFKNIVGMLSKLSKRIYIGDNPLPGDSLAQEAFFVLKLPSMLPEKYATKLNSLQTINEKMNYFKDLYTNNKDELGNFLFRY